MDDTLKEQVKALFGKPQRVVLAVWIYERRGEPFFLGEAQEGIKKRGVTDSGVGAELDTFIAYRMLSQYKDGRRNYYTPQASPLWDAYAAIGAATGLLQDAGDGSVGSRPVDANASRLDVGFAPTRSKARK